MATRAQAKRTIKLRQADAQGREFIRVSARNKTQWASCGMGKGGGGGGINFPMKHKTELQRLSELWKSFTWGEKIVYGGTAVILLVGTVYVAWTFAGSVAASAAASAAAAETGEVVLISVYSASGEFLGFKYVLLSSLKGITTAAAGTKLGEVAAGLVFASAIKKPEPPEFTNFKKPCNPVGQGKF